MWFSCNNLSQICNSDLLTVIQSSFKRFLISYHSNLLKKVKCIQRFYILLSTGCKRMQYKSLDHRFGTSNLSNREKSRLAPRRLAYVTATYIFLHQILHWKVIITSEVISHIFVIRIWWDWACSKGIDPLLN